ncbi:MAG: helix-turn-helix domain-containing protein [Bacteroidales bacterium]|nr:helix-turn-helix domain-containing protein [Bacteroidales bacterium]
MSRVLSEITGLSDKDCFFIVERHKNKFTYPLHCHSEYELNFISNGAGVRRVIGDSIETIGQYELVLVTGEHLEHVWEQGTCNSEDIREITIQFSASLFSEGMLAKNQFESIRKMFDAAKQGICFPQEAIMKVYSTLDAIARQADSFTQFMQCMQILHELSLFEWRTLATSAYAKAPLHHESRRVERIKDYIHAHYAEQITLDEIAGLISMSPSSCSRFFRTNAGKTVTDYILDVRLGNAARALVDTNETVSVICYRCGFNNLSNFNRVFKAKKGMTPSDFRRVYMKKKVTV